MTKNEPNPLEMAFHRRMEQVYEQAKVECGYTATRFLQMVEERGGLQAAKQLLNAGGLSEGLIRLWEEKRLDISMEAAVIEEPWRELFTDEELSAAKNRLRELGFKFESARG